MRVVFTGGSSFTGLWFIRALCARGHGVVATLTRRRIDYEGLRARRVEMLQDEGVEWVEGCRFGDESFLTLLERHRPDLVCHHAAQVGDYRSPDFDIARALQSNTFKARDVLAALHRLGTRAMLITGSVFEPDEGVGSDPTRAFSPYGLSKGLTWRVFQHWSAASDVRLHKFVIANPFGPWEEPRFCAYLMRTWAQGGTATVATPEYVRDNIHVSLLARCYADFAEQCASTDRTTVKAGPAGYIESQGAFARRFAAEISLRLGIAAPLVLAKQTEFAEPFMRVNAERPDAQRLGWDETAAWDVLADFYRMVYLEAR